jgi:Fe2+ or Zn2+ uptake regulation protein
MNETTDAGTKSRTEKDESDTDKNAEYWRLAGNQRDVLRVLDREGPSIGTAVHEALVRGNPDAAKTSVYRALNAVAERGLAVKEEVDERAKRFDLTERGREALETRYAWEQSDAVEGSE